MLKKSVFEHFGRGSAKSVRKLSFFSFSCDVSQKVLENSVFSRFSRHFVQSSQDMRKKNVFWAFCAKVRKNCEKRVFFPVFWETFCTKFAKKVKEQRFFLRDVIQKVWQNSVLSRFSRHFVQCSQKMRKISVFWAFYATFRKKCEKTVFFHVFRDTLCIVSKKCEKTAFFELFAWRS